MLWRKVAVLVLGAALLSAGFALGDTRHATESMVERLDEELEQLESEMTEAGELPETFTTRLDDIRMEAIYLKVKSRKHREAGGEGTGLTMTEVAELRLSMTRLRDDLQSYLAPVSEPIAERVVAELPVGTQFSARLHNTLSTKSAQVGDAFNAITEVPVTHEGQVLIPSGSYLYGVVESVDRPDGRLDRGARLVLAFDKIEVEGQEYALTATVVGASEKMESGLGDEKKKMGIGAGVGAVLGAVLGGKKGAIAGVVLGGSGAILATEGKHVELPRGTMLSLRLDRSLVLPAR